MRGKPPAYFSDPNETHRSRELPVEMSSRDRPGFSLWFASSGWCRNGLILDGPTEKCVLEFDMSDPAEAGTFRLADVFSKALAIFGRRFGPFVVLTVIAQIPLYVAAFTFGTPEAGRGGTATVVSVGGFQFAEYGLFVDCERCHHLRRCSGASGTLFSIADFI